MKKALPVGVDNFQKLITDGYYYTDKTLLIKGRGESLHPPQTLRQDAELKYAAVLL